MRLPVVSTSTSAGGNYISYTQTCCKVGISIKFKVSNAVQTETSRVVNWLEKHNKNVSSILLETARAVPIHHSFLSRAIPIYEELYDVEKLLTKQNLYFIGVPLCMKDGDGMLVRPVVFVF